MPLQITKVSRDPAAEQVLKNFYLDRPVAAIDDGHLIEVSGWAVGRDCEVVALDVRTVTAVIAHGVFGMPRPDVPAALPALDAPTNCGFQAIVSTLGLPEEFQLFVVVHLADGRALSIAEIRGTRNRLPVVPSGGLEPLQVTSLGRSGSTWIMHLLGQHPDLVVFDEWPYELHAMDYFQKRLEQSVTRPHGSDQVPAFAHKTYSWWGQEPFGPFGRPGSEDWFRGEHVELAVRACREGTVSFYRATADRQGKPGARFFAEKCLPYDGDFAREVFGGTREIFLVRDFRDVVCSIISYNRKHGLQEFGAHLAASEAELPAVVASPVQSLADAVAARPDSLVVRYEDLVAEPELSLTRILDHLGLPADAAVVSRTIADANEHVPRMAGHRTTENQAASVGRWRTDLDPAIAAECERVFAGALEAFGYTEPARASRWRRLLSS